jgi:hypothetical protein
MSSWNSINDEIERLSQDRPDAIDVIRRQKMKAVQEVTGRPLIVYATDFITPNSIKAQLAGKSCQFHLRTKMGLTR